MTDDIEIRAAIRGDTEAFATLVRRYQDVAFRTSLLLCRDADDAADALQSALLKVHLHLHRFRIGEPFRPWLLRIVANETRNQVRTRQRHAQRRAEAEAADWVPDHDADVPQLAVAHERSQELLNHLNRLSSADREVITCRYLLELSEAETAGEPEGDLVRSKPLGNAGRRCGVPADPDHRRDPGDEGGDLGVY